MSLLNWSIFFWTVFTAGCAIGPLVSHETARTVGNGHHELSAGYARSAFVAKWNYGALRDLDVGFHLEMLSYGYRMKYAILNNHEQGFSLASAIGYGKSTNGIHYYLDLMGSFLHRPWEPYSTFRVVHVSGAEIEVRSANNNSSSVLSDFTIPSYNYYYGQAIVGTRYWMGPGWFLSLEASNLFFFGKFAEINRKNDIFNVGLALGRNF